MDITVTFPEGKKTTSSEYKGFNVKTGQPESNKGDNSAPSPFDLFLVSIASCAATYVVFFCDNRGIPTKEIKVVQKMQRDPDTHMVTKISIDVIVPKDFPEKYLGAMMKAVDLCAVKKHILDAPEFVLNSVVQA